MAKKEMGIVEKVEGVIRTPGKFFASVASEKSLKPAFVFDATLTAFYVIVSYLIGLAGGNSGIAVVVFNWVFSIIVTFLFVGFFHLFIMLLGGKTGYVNTYKAFVYASTVSLFMLIAMPFANMGIVGTAIGGLVALAVFVWAVYVTTKGISVLQKMSMWKAFASLVLAAIVGLVIIAVAAIAFLWPAISAAVAAA